MTKLDPRPAWDRYRLRSQAVERHLEGHKDGESSPFTDVEPKASGSRWYKPLTYGEFVIAGFSLLGIIMVGYLFLGSDTPQTTAGMVALLALIALGPTVVVLLVVIRADRVAPLPIRFPVFAGLWGMGLATSVAGILNTALMEDILKTLGQPLRAEMLTSVVVAPFGEEATKGIGATLVLLLAAKYLTSKSNGLFIGALVGVGFAFVEDILYFITAEAESSWSLGFTIFGRGVLSPFVHPMATSFTGLFVALAILKARNAWGWVWRVTVGYAVAVGIHAGWNAMATFAGVTWFLGYFLLGMPLFVIWLVWVFRQFPKQLLLAARGLEPYVVTGWVSQEEVTMVCTKVGRKHARKWAKKVGPAAKKAVSSYTRSAGRLGIGQVRMELRAPSRAQQQVARDNLSNLIYERDIFLELGREYAYNQTVRH